MGNLGILGCGMGYPSDMKSGDNISVGMSLLLLINASSTDEVDSILVDAFRYRKDGLSRKRKSTWQMVLDIDAEQTQQLFTALTEMLVASLSTGAPVVPSLNHPQLEKLLRKRIKAHLKEWTEIEINNKISPPQLVDFAWRVDTKSSSNFLSHMSVPTVIVDMKLQKPATKVNEMPGTGDVQFEMNRETLATMLDGLMKIRDQLGSIK